MHQRKRIEVPGRLFVVVILFLTLFPVTSSPARATPAEQYGRYRPRPVTVRRLPGGRVMRIISVTRGGFVASICNQNGPNAETVYAVNDPANDSLAAEPVLFLPGSGQPSSEIKVPLICATPADAVQAYAITPDGEEAPALMVDEGSQTSIVTLPIAAYLVPGTWQLVVEAPSPLTLEIEVPQRDAPRLIVDGESILLDGFRPNEAVRGILLANRCRIDTIPLTEPAESFPPLSEDEQATCAVRGSELLTYIGEFDANVDATGAALIERLDPMLDLTYAFVGAGSGEAIASQANLSDLADAIASGDFVVDRGSLFAEGDQPVPEPVVDKVEPTPAVMPETGAARADASAGFAAMAGMLLFATLLLAAASHRQRTPR